MSTKVSRRTFLGLLGGSFVAAATWPPELAPAEDAPYVAPRVKTGFWRIHELRIEATEAGWMTLRRVGAETPLLQAHVAPGGIFWWSAGLGYDLIFKERDAFEIDGPAGNRWYVYGTDPDGWVFTQDHTKRMVYLDANHS